MKEQGSMLSVEGTASAQAREKRARYAICHNLVIKFYEEHMVEILHVERLRGQISLLIFSDN